MEHTRGPQFSATRFCIKIVLFSYGFFLLRLFTQDIIEHDIHERYEMSALIAAALLIGASLAFSSKNRNRDLGKTSRAGRGHASSAFAILISALVISPVFAGLISPELVFRGPFEHLLEEHHTHSITAAESIDPEALRKTHPSDIVVEVSAEGETSESIHYCPINILELHMLLMGGGDAFAGDRVALQGSAILSDSLENGFSLSRRAMSCCKAHSFPVSINVIGAKNTSLSNDDWVVVRGIIRKYDLNRPWLAGTSYPEKEYYIEAEHVEQGRMPAEIFIDKSFLKKPFAF